jgi:hypothetical protein
MANSRFRFQNGSNIKRRKTGVFVCFPAAQKKGDSPVLFRKSGQLCDQRRFVNAFCAVFAANSAPTGLLPIRTSKPKRIAMKIMLPLVISTSLILAGCAGGIEGEFPSLAKRPFEDNAPIVEGGAATPSAPQSLSAGLQNKVSALEARVRRADSEFQALLPATRNRASSASGATQSSPEWVDAHIQLSRLDRTRADAVAALSELDKLVINQLEAELTGNSPLYSELLKPVQERIGSIVAGQNSQIDAIGKIIGM